MVFRVRWLGNSIAVYNVFYGNLLEIHHLGTRPENINVSATVIVATLTVRFALDLLPHLQGRCAFILSRLICSRHRQRKFNRDSN